MTEKPGKLTTMADVKAFVLGGNATVTLVSAKTKARYTYKIRRADEGGDNRPWFVSVMYGSDNEREYAYMGTISAGSFAYARTSKSKVVEADARHKGFKYLWDRLPENRLPSDIEIWHEGRCGACNRKLTVPESIKSGFGPECAGRRREFNCSAAA